jgi:SAM-dependent methyltransferase
MLENGAHVQTAYEKSLSHNALVAWFHGRRYARLVKLLGTRTPPEQTIRLLEIGCGVGRLYGELRGSLQLAYTGVELDAALAAEAQARYGGCEGFRALHGDAVDLLPTLPAADVVVALETLEHVPAAGVERILDAVATMRPGLFVCSVPVELGPSLWAKNLSSVVMGYSRHREYSWPETWWAGVGRLDKLPAHTTWHKGFDWRQMVASIKRRMRVTRAESLPAGWLPVGLGTSVFLVAEPR